MIRNGQLAEPINECTIASTLQRLLLDIKAIGGDQVHLPNGVSTPAVVIETSPFPERRDRQPRSAAKRCGDRTTSHLAEDRPDGWVTRRLS